MSSAGEFDTETGLDAVDRLIVAATQQGLPLTPRPYHDIADQLGLTGPEVMARLQAMLDAGIIRRIATVPNHYKLGYRGNGMSVWNVSDDEADAAGREIGALDFVSHCYRRPRHLPDWPYNLFAMVHGRDRAAVHDQVARIADLLGARDRGHKVLFSTAILKKTGFRLGAPKSGDRR